MSLPEDVSMFIRLGEEIDRYAASVYVSSNLDIPHIDITFTFDDYDHKGVRMEIPSDRCITLSSNKVKIRNVEEEDICNYDIEDVKLVCLRQDMFYRCTSLAFINYTEDEIFAYLLKNYLNDIVGMFITSSMIEYYNHSPECEDVLYIADDLGYFKNDRIEGKTGIEIADIVTKHMDKRLIKLAMTYASIYDPGIDMYTCTKNSDSNFCWDKNCYKHRYPSSNIDEIARNAAPMPDLVDQWGFLVH